MTFTASLVSPFDGAQQEYRLAENGDSVRITDLNKVVSHVARILNVVAEYEVLLFDYVIK